MKAGFLIGVFALFILTGCAGTWQPVCRQEAVLTAITVGEYHQTEIVCGRTPWAEWHCQSRFFDWSDPQMGWQWLCYSVTGGVYVCPQDFANRGGFKMEEHWSPVGFVQGLSLKRFGKK